MKDLIKTLTLFSLLLFLGACGNDDDGGIGNNASCQISWKVDGQSESEEPLVCLYNDNTLNLGLTGSNLIQLQVNNLTQPGTYDLAGQDAIILLELGSGEKLGSNTGQIIVTEISSSKAKGTFSGTFFPILDPNTPNTFSVTDGKFSANF
ncbi:MAG TPA: hypothetical protein ENJ95_17015 [Bacteroidetes bacterium]|nr:hypothetical protein [Bacteroidota bacterium]